MPHGTAENSFGPEMRSYSGRSKVFIWAGRAQTDDSILWVTLEFSCEFQRWTQNFHVVFEDRPWHFMWVLNVYTSLTGATAPIPLYVGTPLSSYRFLGDIYGVITEIGTRKLSTRFHVFLFMVERFFLVFFFPAERGETDEQKNRWKYFHFTYLLLYCFCSLFSHEPKGTFPLIFMNPNGKEWNANPLIGSVRPCTVFGHTKGLAIQ